MINDNAGEREASSSGGAFSILARAAISEGGSVWGAATDRACHIRHIEVRHAEELAALRGSKYVESCLDESFRRIKERLQAGRRVVFSGTPCQVAGLRRYLGKPYRELLLIETACHGVQEGLYLFLVKIHQHALHDEDKFPIGMFAAQVVHPTGFQQGCRDIDIARLFGYQLPAAFFCPHV